MLLRADNIIIKYRNHNVLDNVSFAVSPKQILTIIGPNGAGKTTLLKAILGLVPLSGGTLWKKTGLRIGYMPQRLDLNPLLQLTVADFLRLAEPSASAHAIAAILEEVGATSVQARFMSQLSGGELQRILLASTLLIEPDLMVLDEPAQGVDVVGQAELYRLITMAKARRGCSILLVSHDLHLVMSASDHVICLNHHVCCSGHPDAVLQDASYQSLFPQATWKLEGLAPYVHHHDHHHD
ncbi:MAG: metal ABC transporter ATP-binding protein [Alphaproteobacteria bacterium]